MVLVGMGKGSGVAQAVNRVLAAIGENEPATADRLGVAYQAELAKDRRGRRQAAAFYTPPYLVEFVTDIGLAAALKGRTAEQILSLRVLDPACGAGVFLTAALFAIEAALERLGLEAGPALRAEIAARCIRGVDIDPVAVELCRVAIADATGGGKADITFADSLLAEHPPCDVVLTNPPWGQKQLRFAPEVGKLLRARYVTARGVLDPFKLFIELATRVVAPGGRWAMVLPDIVLLKNHEPTRRLMLESSAIEWIAHVGRAFPGVNLDACVIAGVRRPPASDHAVATLRSLSPAWKTEKQAAAPRLQSVFSGLAAAKFNIVASDDDLARIERLRDLPRLGSRYEIHEGVHSGNRRAAIFNDAPATPCAALVVGGSEIVPFSLRWNGRYLNLDPLAIDRESGGYATLGRCEWHHRKKILVRRTGDEMVVAFDRRGLYASNNFFVVVPRFSVSDDEQRAMTALLGSAFMTWYFRTVQPRVGRLFAELKINQLADFPLAELSRGETRSLAQLVRSLEGPSRCDRSAIRAELDRQVAAAYARLGA